MRVNADSQGKCGLTSTSPVILCLDEDLDGTLDQYAFPVLLAIKKTLRFSIG